MPSNRDQIEAALAAYDHIVESLTNEVRDIRQQIEAKEKEIAELKERIAEQE